MFWTNVKRIFRSGFIAFWRNGFVSLASVLIMAVTLFVLGSLIFGTALMRASLRAVENKIDVSIYFVPGTPESDVMALKAKLEALPEVLKVGYLSSEETLADFEARNQNDETTLQALNEVGGNPFGDSLSIKAKNPSQYEGIANFAENAGTGSLGATIIEKINYYENKSAITTISAIINGGETIGFAVIMVLAFISVVIVFNTIRLAIYIARDEISVMRLVGASNQYVRGPFIVSGIMYGLTAGLLTLIAFYPVTYFVSRITERFFSGMNLFSYYLSHFGNIFAIIIGAGMTLGAVSSILAVRKYLKV